MRVPHIDQIVQGVEVHLTASIGKPRDARREGRVPGDIRLREIVPGVQRRRLVRVEPADARRHDRVLALHQADDLDARLATYRQKLPEAVIDTIPGRNVLPYESPDACVSCVRRWVSEQHWA